MVHLYNEKNIPDNLLDIKIPWDSYFQKQKVTKYLSDTDVRIVESVEGTSLLNNSTIYSKFSDMPIGIEELSEGCKTLLCINHTIKVGDTKDIIFNIASCGGNAVNYLITEIGKNANINVYSKLKIIPAKRTYTHHKREEVLPFKCGDKVIRNKRSKSKSKKREVYIINNIQSTNKKIIHDSGTEAFKYYKLLESESLVFV